MPEPLTSPVVGVHRMESAVYPSEVPFNPDEAWPEYPWTEIATGENGVYRGVRDALRLMGLDAERYGSREWDPLGDVVRPGDLVVVKPNLIWHSHRHRPQEWQAVITNGSVVRAVVDYVLIALRGAGEVWIADGPQLDADWETIVERTGLGEIESFYAGRSDVPVRLLDLREQWTDVRNDVRYGAASLPGDPRGSTVVDLGAASRLRGPGFDGARYYGADYDQDETNGHHRDGRHEYRLSRTVMSADVLVNVPKMKTHKKCGVTLAAKNLVGVCAGRNWLPHYREGDPSVGGDQFASGSAKSVLERRGIRLLQRAALKVPRSAPFFSLAKSVAKPVFGRTTDTIRSGNWSGNDTVWRMVHDIDRCVLYHDGDGRPRTEPKRCFAIVDGVVAGHGDGPETPDEYAAGTIVAGHSWVAVDYATTLLMGLDPERIPVVREAFADSGLPLARFTPDDVVMRSNHPAWDGRANLVAPGDCHRFRPHFGWIGGIERALGETPGPAGGGTVG